MTPFLQFVIAIVIMIAAASVLSVFFNLVNCDLAASDY